MRSPIDRRINELIGKDVFEALTTAVNTIENGQGNLIEKPTFERLLREVFAWRDPRKPFKSTRDKMEKVARVVRGGLQPDERNLWWQLCHRQAVDLESIFRN